MMVMLFFPSAGGPERGVLPTMRPHLECRRRPHGLFVLLAALLWAVCGGCADRAPDAVGRVYETWDAVYVQGAKVGHTHTSEREFVEGGERRVRTDMDFELALTRFGQATVQRLNASSTETLDGDVLWFEYELAAGPSVRHVRGTVDGDVLSLESTIAGKTTTSEMAWPRGTGGFFAIEQSLRRSPMRPGERRLLRSMQPLVDAIADVELVAEQFETTTSSPGELLRVRMTQQFGQGVATKATYWTDAEGDVQRMLIDGMQMESVRTTREVALGAGDSADFDLGLDLLVKVDRPLADVHETRRAVYEVILEGGDPARAFSSGVSQQVEPIGEDTARIVVTAIRSDQPASDVPTGDEPAAEDRQPSALIQSDDPLVVAMAEGVVSDLAAGEIDPWQTAVALENFVSRTVEVRDFSQVFASAAEVAASKQGDCTEHAVLLAALCRAREIPARVAMGLVYVEEKQGFLYHMWTEAWIRDRWIPLDGTLGQGGIGAAHLKLSDSSLAGPSALADILPIINVVGRLKIKVVEAE